MSAECALAPRIWPAMSLYADGTSTDERFVLNASGIPLLTQLGLSDLGITEKLEDGPVLPR